MLLIGRDPFHILKNYGWALSWKIALFFKVCGCVHTHAYPKRAHTHVHTHGSRRPYTHTLKIYAHTHTLHTRAQLTAGYWDWPLIKAMDIKLTSETYDEDPLDDTARDGDTVRIMGVSHNVPFDSCQYLTTLPHG